MHYSETPIVFHPSATINIKPSSNPASPVVAFNHFKYAKERDLNAASEIRNVNLSTTNAYA